MQRFVDHVLAITKESVKTLTYEFLNYIVRLINGISALVLAILPGKKTILEGIHGWELKPTFRGPRLPQWMEHGVSSFNQFIHELSVDSDVTSSEHNLSENEDYDESICPASPLSQSSCLSRASSFKYDRQRIRWFRYLISWIFWPVSLTFGMPFRVYHLLNFGRLEISPGTPRTKLSNVIKDQIVHRTTDRRRGIIEDLHLAIEIFIEVVFDIVHKGAHCLLSPSEAFRTMSSWFSSTESVQMDASSKDTDVSVSTDTIADDYPTSSEIKDTIHHSLNTDVRTCQDVIRELGYPYEAIRVITSDGYVLLIERIPRRDAQKVVYLQHGLLDSSMGWVSNGVVGSPAFAAYDQGYDVFLGNLRGLVSREHVDKNISSRDYWRYSINEHGTQDIPSMIEKIHQVKMSELRGNQCVAEDENDTQPYKLCAVSHSLGGAAMLIYIITRRIEQQPHRLSRLILLSPAGFHEDSTIVFSLVEHLILLLEPVLAPLIPGIYIPTRFFRMIVNKLARDFHNYPALGGLVQTLMSYVVGGDSSNWVGVLGTPHYNMYDMPGVSFYVAVHLAQIKRSGKFIMYDFGSPSANMKAYGSPVPLDVGQHYGHIDIPVDLVAGQKDKVIRSSMVRKHYKLMKNAGVQVSYNEFEYAHLDFTFSHREELLAYVMSRLLLVVPPDRPSGQKATRLKRTGSNSFSGSSNRTLLSLSQKGYNLEED